MTLEALGIDARRKAAQWWAACPNPDHKDRNPSWRIRDEPGKKRDGYHACPPCGFEGGLISLIVHMRKCATHEAGALLTDIENGLGIARKDPPESVSIISRPTGFQLRAGIVVAPLDKWSPMAREYALSRGITAEQVDRWGIGYADEGHLSHRLVLITRNSKGVAWNYTARTYTRHVKRYFEPEHWERADRNVMFGEQHWHKDRSECVVVTEGGFKALAVERAMPELALGATAGSAIMPGYPIKLVQFSRILVATDADDTGDRIADELLFMLRRQRARAERWRLPDGVQHDDVPVNELREQLQWALAGIA